MCFFFFRKIANKWKQKLNKNKTFITGGHGRLRDSMETNWSELDGFQHLCSHAYQLCGLEAKPIDLSLVKTTAWSGFPCIHQPINVEKPLMQQPWKHIVICLSLCRVPSTASNFTTALLRCDVWPSPFPTLSFMCLCVGVCGCTCKCASLSYSRYTRVQTVLAD